MVGFMSPAEVWIPVLRKVCKGRHVRHRRAPLLRIHELFLNCLRTLSEIVHAQLSSINLREWRMVLDLCVPQRLRYGRVIYFAMAVTAIADQIDHDVAVKRV